MKPKILVVDDDAHLLQSMARTLRKPFEVAIEETPEAGLETLAMGGPFSVVVSDFQMPGLNGIDFLLQVRAMAPDTSRILLTGRADLESAIREVNKGHLFRFLTKPCEQETLEMALHAGVRQYQLIRAEKSLLDQTLRGTVEALLVRLEALHPRGFGRAQRAGRWARAAAASMNLETGWAVYLAGVLASLARLDLPAELLERQYLGVELGREDAFAFVQAQEAWAEALVKVPHLEPVVEALRHLGPPPEGEDALGGQVPRHRGLEAQLVRGALDLGDLVDRNRNLQEVALDFEAGGERFETSVVAALLQALERDPQLQTTVPVEDEEG